VHQDQDRKVENELWKTSRKVDDALAQTARDLEDDARRRQDIANEIAIAQRRSRMLAVVAHLPSCILNFGHRIAEGARVITANRVADIRERTWLWR
jgi:hypothetical protein